MSEPGFDPGTSTSVAVAFAEIAAKIEEFEGKLPTTGSTFTVRGSTNAPVSAVRVFSLTSSPHARYSKPSGDLYTHYRKGKYSSISIIQRVNKRSNYNLSCHSAILFSPFSHWRFFKK